MKRWIHSRENSLKFNKVIASSNKRDMKKVVQDFKKKYPKAYEVLGK